MLWQIAPLAAITLAGFSDPQGPAPEAQPAAAPDRISYAGNGNGRTGWRTFWWIDRSGHGAYRTTIRVEMDGKFNAGPEGFERIRAILRPLEDVRELPCDGAVTDQGTGALSWRRGDRDASLRFDLGCNFRQPDAAQARLGQAEKLVQQWANAK